MADTDTGTTPQGGIHSSGGISGTFWYSPLIGVMFFVNSLGDVAYARTTDAGANWSQTTIQLGNAKRFNCYWDRQTPGDTGDLVHCAWLDSSSQVCRYVDYDLSSDTVGTIRTVASSLTVSGTPQNNRCDITKTVGGNLLTAFETPTEIACYRSTDSGVNWTSRADVFEAAASQDWAFLYPAATADDDDAAAIFWDSSANAISVKMYDDSADTWTETAIASSMTGNVLYENLDASVRLSDSHILMAAHSSFNNNGDDLMTWDLTVDSIAAPTVTAKTNIFTDQPESGNVSIIINQQNDDVYAGYLYGTSWQGLTSGYYKLSTDDMSTWGAEQSYTEDAEDDNRLLGRISTITSLGGVIQFTIFNDDTNLIYVNLNNDISIAAATTGTNFQVNIGDDWKEVDGIQINIGDAWKEVAGVQVNIGDTWKEIY